MKQQEAVIQTLEKLGGIATLGQLNQEVFKIKECEWKTKTPFASIRRIVQLHKDIYKIKPGLYALKSHKKDIEQKGIFVETEDNKDSEEIKNFNHSYYQGLLLTIGNMKNFKTFVPHQDKNRFFANTKLGNLQTIQDLPPFSYTNFTKRASTIDTIWLNERQMPSAFFEVEHSTDIQNSLLKYNDLQDFHVEMFIVADEKRKNEFLKKLDYVAFDKLKKENRVKFLSYNGLENWYSLEIKKSELGIPF